MGQVGLGIAPEVNPNCWTVKQLGFISSFVPLDLCPKGKEFFLRQPSSVRVALSPLSALSLLSLKKHIPLSSQFSIFNSQFSIQVQYFPNPAVIHTHRSEVRLQ